jgi:hypothetical protein
MAYDRHANRVLLHVQTWSSIDVDATQLLLDSVWLHDSFEGCHRFAQGSTELCATEDYGHLFSSCASAFHEACLRSLQ